MISHVFTGVTDFERAYDFYAAVLPVLGLELKFKDPSTPWAAWMVPGQPRPLFIVGRPWEGQNVAGNGQMTALLASSRPAVDAFHAAALAHGATCEGPPGLRPRYHANYYGAYIRDTEGNKVAVACHDPV